MSFPNLFAYAMQHKVNCFAPHDHKYLDALTLLDWERYLGISVKNARTLLRQGYTETFNIINFGKLAGGTQAHPHSQDGVLVSDGTSRIEWERGQFKVLSNTLDDPFGEYFQFARKNGLDCLETEEVMVMAPYAPQFPDQIEIYVKPRSSSLLSLQKNTIRDLAKALHHTTHFLSTQRGVTDMNFAIHQDTLDSSSSYRLHLHLFPRNKNIPAGMEFAYSQNVIDTFPEQTAEAYRAYFAGLPEYAR